MSTVLCSLDEVLADAPLVDAWRELAQAQRSFQPMLDPCWWQAAARHLLVGARLDVLYCRDAQGLRWLVVLQRTRRVPAVAVMRSVKHDHLPVAALLCREGVGASEAFDEISRGLRQHRAGWLRLVRAPAMDDAPGFMSSGPSSPAYVLPCASPEDVLRGASRSRRKQLRRHTEQMAEGREVTFRHVIVPEQGDALRAFFALEASGWKAETNTAIGQHDDLRAFYTDVAKAFAARQQFHLFLLLVDGVPVAAEYALSSGSHLYALKGAYDEQWADYSPGHQLLAAVWRWCSENGFEEYNQVTSADWLVTWGPLRQETASGFVFPPGIYGRLQRACLAGMLRLRGALTRSAAVTPVWVCETVEYLPLMGV